jgi:hypothetical protein
MFQWSAHFADQRAAAVIANRIFMATAHSVAL